MQSGKKGRYKCVKVPFHLSSDGISNGCINMFMNIPKLTESRIGCKAVSGCRRINEKRMGDGMSIKYQRLTERELDTFITMRIKQLKEEGTDEDMDLRPALKDYYNRHMAEGTFVSWLAIDNGRIIATSGISFVEKPPYFGNPSGKLGLLSSMYTDAGYRRKGIAKELLFKVVNEAKKYGCGTVQITASDMGVFLYTAFGFVKNGNFMQFNLF